MHIMHNVISCREISSEDNTPMENQWKNISHLATQPFLFFSVLDTLSCASVYPQKYLSYLKTCKISSYTCGTIVSEGVMWFHK